MGKKNLLVTLADDSLLGGRNDLTFLDAAKQLFSSAYFNAGWKGDFMVLTTKSTSEKKLDEFRKKGILVRKFPLIYPKGTKFQGRDAKLFVKFHVFELEEVLSKKYNSVVVLDSDIIVRTSLDNLTKVKEFAAVLRKFRPRTVGNLFKTKEKSKFFKKSKKDLNKKSFHSGVFSFNTSFITKNTFQDLIDLVEKYKGIVKEADESILNLYFKNWEKKSPFFNVSPMWFNYEVHVDFDKIEARIIHFLTIDGNVKRHRELLPWNKTSPFYNEWKNNYDKFDKFDLNKKHSGRSLLNYNFIYILFKLQIWFFKKGFKEILQLWFPHPIDRGLGKIGEQINKKFPKLYWWLKKHIKFLKDK